MDKRLILARPDLAALAYEGVVSAARFAPSQAMQCILPAASVRSAPAAGAEQATQLLFGERFEVLETKGGWAFGQCVRDRYVGYVHAEALAPLGEPPGHWVHALRTYAFAAPDLKSPVQTLLSMNCLCRTEAEEGRFVQVAGAGWVFAGHLSLVGEVRVDLAGVAQEFVGAPYYWGGRESIGLDCSGLVQNALYALGRSCPRDSDQQFAELGEPVGPERLQRGDLVFWHGHVAVMLDEHRIVHASGHQMQTVIERLATAIDRIRAADGGEPKGYRRPV